jgi:nucleotide-binding universal stress UspA family protein
MTDMGALQQEQVQGGTGGRSFSDILCAVDGTRKSFAAVEQAATLAGPQGHLTLLAVTAVTGAGAYRTAAISPPRAEQMLERARKIAERHQVASEVLVDPRGPAPEVVLEHAIEHDLLALGAPAASWLAGKLTDGVTAAAIKELKTPLLACRRLTPGEQRFAERILVASDGLEGSDQLIELAGHLARECDGSVVLLHVTGVESRVAFHTIESQTRRLGDLIKDSSDVRVEVGDAAEAIVLAADEADASLILMGSRRLKGLRAIGSVSRRVVREAHCSVLLLPPSPE